MPKVETVVFFFAQQMNKGKDKQARTFCGAWQVHG
jgi:hypothetical protein